jgi:hypothetical protein
MKLRISSGQMRARSRGRRLHYCVYKTGFVQQLLLVQPPLWSGGPGSIPDTTKKKVVCLERGPLSLVSTTEELLGKVSAPV